MPSSSLHVLESYDSKKPKEPTKVRLEHFQSYQDAVEETIRWAGKGSCRCFGIEEKLAKRIYKGVDIVALQSKKIPAVKKAKL